MSQFLWIEDFQSDGEKVVSPFTEAVFGEILTKPPEDTKEEVKKTLKDHSVLLECTFLDGLEFIRDPKKLFQIDYIILDVDLIVKDDIDENNLLPDILELYSNESGKTPEEALKETAGYQLYIELVMGLDFPKDHILFCSNHINQLESLKDAFKKAKIQNHLPPTPDGKLALSKDEPDKEALRAWIRKRRNNPYSVLRRGIIEGCQDIQSLIRNPENIQFGEFTRKNAHEIAQDMRDYLDILPKLLPLREPPDKEPLYKLFVRTLAHEWETSANPEFFRGENKNLNETFGWIMKNTRNWVSHSDILNNLEAPDIAFLFIVAMRAMFRLDITTQKHEKMLLALFEQERLSADEIKNRIKNKDVPLMDTYLAVRNANIPVKEATLFRKMLDKMQSENIPHNYMRGLFQIFWHGLFPITLSSTPENKLKKINKTTFLCEMECQFRGDYNYDKMEFLFELARSIYKRSFPV